MHEITCPHCKKAFKIDEAGYAEILKQVRDADFDKQLHERMKLAEKDKKDAIELATTKAASESEKAVAAKDAEIRELEAKLEAGEIRQKLAVTEAVSMVEKERDQFAQELKQMQQEIKAASQLAKAMLDTEIQKVTSEKDVEIQRLKTEIDCIEDKHQLATTEKVNKIEKERDELKSELEKSELAKKLSEQSLKDKYQTQIDDRDDTIERLKEMKARLSTKMIGETLEEHCATEFNRIRATAFPSAYFEKDTDVKTGSKGDFIFRDSDGSGIEILSIMFDMKNEMDETASKKKNEDFLKELDKDRNEKNVNTRYLFHFLSRKANFTTPVSSMFRTAFQKCTSFDPNSLSRLSRCCETQPKTR